MKKITAMFLAAATAIAFVGCGGPGGTKEPEKPEDPPDNDYGTLTVSDTYAWLADYESKEFPPLYDYPATEFVLNFSKPEKAEAVSYEYDSTAIELDERAHTVKALKNGITEVKVTSEHFETTFNVICETVNKDREDKGYSLTKHRNGDPKGWDARVRNFQTSWSDNGHNDITTVFIGDSFFDSSAFWTSFYTDYNGKDALCFGIGGTTTCSWETIIYEFMSRISPKNVVMHCGTNDVYDLGRSADEITSSLERIFSVMHDFMPDASLYWFNIPKRYPGEAAKEAVSEAANARFAKWAEGRDWLTVMDTRATLGIDKVLQDGLHPNADGYKMFMDALAKTKIKIYNLN
ncbi:MAG: SGNH/GDSL hydrolase family protein [Clostridiales bacterium]|nr:SGNH/GDSL hydrolase family protein [Clostridiales bacterium]